MAGVTAEKCDVMMRSWRTIEGQPYGGWLPSVQSALHDPGNSKLLTAELALRCHTANMPQQVIAPLGLC